MILRNAAFSVKAPKPKKEEIRPLDREQVRAFFDAVSGERLEPLYVLAVTAGLRKGVLLGLKWEDLDPEAGTLQVRRSLSQARSGRIFETPKGGKGRSIRLTRRAVSALREHRRRQLEERMKLAGLWQEHGLVFPSQVGTPLGERNLSRAFKRPRVPRGGARGPLRGPVRARRPLRLEGRRTPGPEVGGRRPRRRKPPSAPDAFGDQDGAQVRAPKNGKGRRIKITAGATEALKRHRKLQLEERMRLAGLWEDHGLVFPNRVGKTKNAKALTSRSFKPLLERAGLPKTVRVHDLRHTCATVLLSKGVHPKFVQELLGHANIAITLDTNSHVLPGMGDQTATAMENALS